MVYEDRAQFSASTPICALLVWSDTRLVYPSSIGAAGSWSSCSGPNRSGSRPKWSARDRVRRRCTACTESSSSRPAARGLRKPDASWTCTGSSSAVRIRPATLRTLRTHALRCVSCGSTRAKRRGRLLFGDREHRSPDLPESHGRSVLVCSKSSARAVVLTSCAPPRPRPCVPGGLRCRR